MQQVNDLDLHIRVQDLVELEVYQLFEGYQVSSTACEAVYFLHVIQFCHRGLLRLLTRNSSLQQEKNSDAHCGQSWRADIDDGS